VRLLQFASLRLPYPWALPPRAFKTYYWPKRRVTSFGPVFLVVVAIVGGNGHVWTCRDGGGGNGRRGHSRGGGRPSSLRFFVTSSYN
jgi:hypothetical protein